MSEAWEVVNEYILPFFEFLKKNHQLFPEPHRPAHHCVSSR